jgi:uncharacterized cupin superfamily protein
MSIAARAEASVPDPEARTADDIRQLGFSSPIPMLSPAECAALDEHLNAPDRPPPLDWWKGHAPADREIYEIAAKPRLIALLRPLLGEDIVLWGAGVTSRRPGTRHPWHTDMESADPGCRVISAWIGIRNTSKNSGLWFVTGSHLFGRCVQEVMANLQEDRKTVSDERIAEIAQAIDPAARIVRSDAQDGEVVLFDGRAWHSSRNDSTLGTRAALLLQYASVDTPIPMPMASAYGWPLQFAASPRVPAILVSGTGRNSANRLVPPPPPFPSKGMPMITTLARSVTLPLAEDPVKRWAVYSQFRGPTRTFERMSCHISVLSPGHHPHPPHIHPEEEVLIVLDGEVEIEIADDPQSTGSRRLRLRPGMLSYYPSTQHHTIHNVSATPTTYLMFKWHAGRADTATPLLASVFDYDISAVPDNPKPIVQTLLFQQATHYLGKLHAHLTILQPGAGYEPHADAYDVAIVVLSGEVETVGERVTALGIVYYSAGELHGMRNVGNIPATYLVFEFHSPAVVAAKQQRAEIQRRQRAEREARQAEQRAQRAERQRRKLEKQRRKRGVRGLIRKIVKAVKRLGR